MGTEHACHRVKAEDPELLEKTLIKGLSEGGVCCRRKARARTAVGVGSQRELGCHENSAADGFQAQVHLAVDVTENSIANDFFCEGIGVLELIVFSPQTKTIKPCPILPRNSPSAVIDASETR